ncbi:MAG: hypothetical protein U1G07_10650 [Verrucomicrobiota bacterium]
MKGLRYPLIGALILGGFGLAAGFFGPIIFTPAANQGPLLGIFVTGPVGVLIGFIAGGIYQSRQRRKWSSPLATRNPPGKTSSNF